MQKIDLESLEWRKGTQPVAVYGRRTGNLRVRELRMHPHRDETEASESAEEPDED